MSRRLKARSVLAWLIDWLRNKKIVIHTPIKDGQSTAEFQIRHEYEGKIFIWKFQKNFPENLRVYLKLKPKEKLQLFSKADFNPQDLS